MTVFRTSWLLALVALGSAGCASNSGPIVDMLSAVVKQKLGTTAGAEVPTAPNPAYRYLRVDVAGRAPALLVLGYLDADPHGEIEVWYSSKGEVIRTQHGRIVGTVGLEVDWRAVRYASPLPDWAAVSTQGATYGRSRDVFPGYRYGLSERVNIQRLPALPAITLPQPMPPALASQYRWFRETVSGPGSTLPPAWFAWGVHQGQSTVVYSEQCLAVDFCLKLLRWPLAVGSL